ncbi:B3 domain-containing protein REM1 [Raphanus sativus]|nr:B3 domain-containing protein REM1 [Raphanus sativus]
MVVPPKPSLYHLRFLTGDKPLLTLDDEFLRNHTKVLLTSDASDKIWKVKLDGNRLAGGWEEFAAIHNFSDGDVLVFRHNGDETFHVSVSSESDDESDDTDDSESDESDDAEDDDNDDDDDDDEGDVLVEKNKKPEADTSPGDSCLLRASVTPSSLIDDRLYLSTDFKFTSFDEHKKPCEIYLANEKGRKWTLILSRNISNGAFNIRRGWANFCSANGLSQGDICNFKLSESGERPELLLCSRESGNNDAVKICSVGGCSKEKTTSEKNTPRFLTLEYTPNRVKTGQLTISKVFLGESGINKSMEITLLKKDGRKWSSYLQMSGQPGREMFYIRNDWREMCKANGVQVKDSFVLELICENANPIFKFHSKIENKGKGKIITRKKRARHLSTVENTPEGSKRGRTRVSNRSNTNLKREQPESCSVSDQVANVKQSIQDTLNTIRHFRGELETREKNLEASLLEVDDLGERILGISKILNNNLV